LKQKTQKFLFINFDFSTKKRFPKASKDSFELDKYNGIFNKTAQFTPTTTSTINKSGDVQKDEDEDEDDDLEAQLKIEKQQMLANLTTNNNKKDLNEIERIGQLKLAKLTEELNDQMQKEISDLKEEKHRLEMRLVELTNENTKAASGRLEVEQLYQKQIEELNKDRRALNAMKQELNVKLIEKDAELKASNLLLIKTTEKLNEEKSRLSVSETELRNQLNNQKSELLKEKEKRERQHDTQLEEIKMENQNLKNDLEIAIKKMNQTKDDIENERRIHKNDLEKMNTKVSNLMEQLAASEASKMVADATLSSDDAFTKKQVDERQRQIDQLKSDIKKLKEDHQIELNHLRKEAEEKNYYSMKCQNLEENCRKYSNEIAQLKIEIERQAEQHEVSLNKSLNEEKSQESINNQKQIKTLRLALAKSEQEKNQLKDEIQKEIDSKQSLMMTNSHQIISNNDTDYLKVEVEKLKENFNRVLAKYSSLEDENKMLKSNDFLIEKNTQRRDPIDITS
jgi:hypothetical protein